MNISVYRVSTLLSILGCLLLSLGCTQGAGDQVFINGQIITMDSDNRIVEALYVESGKIVAVGSNAEIEAYITDNSEVTDLEGKTLVPGFIDAHGHFPGSGLKVVQVDLYSPPIGVTQNISDIISVLSTKASSTSEGDWVIGFGYDDTLLAEKRHPNRQDLDLVSSKHPIIILHSSGHLGSVNSLALVALNIDRSTSDPDGGVIQRDINGEPTGVMEETALDIFLPIVEAERSIFDMLNMTYSASQEYISVGVTTAQNGKAEKLYIDALGMGAKLRVLPLRVVVWPDVKVGREMLAGNYNPQNYNSEFFSVGAIKMVADGSIQGYTGYLREPYYTPYKDDPEYRGYPRTDLETLTEDATNFYQAGYQVAIHGNGDAAIDDIIHAVSEAQSLYPNDDARTIVVHAQMAQDEQLDSMKTLGMAPSFFSLHTYYWGDRHRDIFMGEERAMRMSPAKSALDRGLQFTIHSDTPVVPMDPMLLVWSAVNRVSYLGNQIGEAQKISPIDALRSITIDAAWQMFLEDHRGSIEVGKVADLVMLDSSPLINPQGIKDIEVLQTFVNGRSVYIKN